MLCWRTKSANESNSCPMRLLFFLHLATLPSMKSKNKPKGMKARAAHIGAYESGGPRQYRMELRIDMKPQKPTPSRQQPFVIVKDVGGPFISVIKSAKCRALCSTLYQLGHSCEDPSDGLLDHWEMPSVRRKKLFLLFLTWMSCHYVWLNIKGVYELPWAAIVEACLSLAPLAAFGLRDIAQE